MKSYLNLFIHNMYSIHLFLCHDKFIHNFQGHISQNCVYPLHMDTDKLFIRTFSMRPGFLYMQNCM